MTVSPHNDDGFPVLSIQNRKGRPKKDPPTAAEKVQVQTWRNSGWGWDSIASELSAARTAKVGTPQAKARRAVSAQWCRNHFSNESHSPTKYRNPKGLLNLQRNQKSTCHSGSGMACAVSSERKEIDTPSFAPQKGETTTQQSVEVETAGGKA